MASPLENGAEHRPSVRPGRVMLREINRLTSEPTFLLRQVGSNPLRTESVAYGGQELTDEFGRVLILPGSDAQVFSFNRKSIKHTVELPDGRAVYTTLRAGFTQKTEDKTDAIFIFNDGIISGVPGEGKGRGGVMWEWQNCGEVDLTDMSSLAKLLNLARHKAACVLDKPAIHLLGESITGPRAERALQRMRDALPSDKRAAI